MAGVSVEGGGGGGRKKVDSEINMIPMIDLLMVTISFLLITAVWTHMSRVEATAKVPGDQTAPPCEPGDPCDKKPELHVDMRHTDRFVLSWREGGTVVRTLDVTRLAHKPAQEPGSPSVRFPELSTAITNEWTHGMHAPGTERAVLHAADDARYEDMIAAMDAIYQVRRPEKGAPPAFAVTLSTN